MTTPNTIVCLTCNTVVPIPTLPTLSVACACVDITTRITRRITPTTPLVFLSSGFLSRWQDGSVILPDDFWKLADTDASPQLFGEDLDD